MWKKTLVVVISVVVCVGTFAAQQSNEAAPPTANTQKAAEAALAYAKTLAKEDTPEYTAALRRSLALSQGMAIPEDRSRAFFGIPALTRGLIDLDPRYRRNFRSMSPQVRIWFGEPVEKGQFMDTVAITGNGGLCTGTIIAANAVLTAAHCFCGGVSERVHIGDMITGSVVTATVSGGRSMIQCTDDLKNGDIAVLTLSQPVTVTPRALADDPLITAATAARAVGFGRTEDPINKPAGIKRRVDVPVASALCNGTVQTTEGAVSDEVFYRCAPGHELVAGAPMLGKDTCNGDSGGPLFVTGADGLLYLGAATSRPTGQPGIRPCGDGGIYVRTGSRVASWLKSVGVSVKVGSDH
jgi:hypothetical protein